MYIDDIFLMGFQYLACLHNIPYDFFFSGSSLKDVRGKSSLGWPNSDMFEATYTNPPRFEMKKMWHMAYTLIQLLKGFHWPKEPIYPRLDHII